MSFLGRLTQQQPFQITTYQIYFQIHPRARAVILDDGFLLSMGNYIDREMGPFHLVDREAGTIDADGTLGGNITRQPVGSLEFQAPALAIRLKGFQLADSIHVAADQMPS